MHCVTLELLLKAFQGFGRKLIEECRHQDDHRIFGFHCRSGSGDGDGAQTYAKTTSSNHTANVNLPGSTRKLHQAQQLPKDWLRFQCTAKKAQKSRGTQLWTCLCSRCVFEEGYASLTPLSGSDSDWCTDDSCSLEVLTTFTDPAGVQPKALAPALTLFDP